MIPTEWKPCELHAGYEQRLNGAGHLETRVVGPELKRMMPSWEKFSAKEWALALQGLTPGGSEFLTPEECAFHVRKKFAHPSTFVAQKERIQKLESALRAILLDVQDLRKLTKPNTDFSDILDTDIGMAQRALEP